MKEDQAPQRDKPKISPAVILIIIALVVFGLMYGFTYFENQNPEWLRPSG